MKEQENNPEQSKEQQIAERIKRLHEEFFAKVPNYERGMWDPRQAIKEKRGSCMAELLYVAGGLIVDGKVLQKDLFVGFSKDHGEVQDVGFVGKTGKKYAHTFLLITVDGITLEADFRANRADEHPRIQRLLEDEIDDDQIYLGPLDEAVNQYARIEEKAGPTVSELIALHLGDDTLIASASQLEEREIRFDEEF